MRFIFSIFVLCVTLSACADGRGYVAEHGEIADPYEASNRKMLAFHTALDRALIRPATKAYVALTTAPMRISTKNVISNLSTPLDTVNNFLQGEGKRGGISLARFLINSTLGVFGLFDPASSLGLMPKHEDFGQTLAKWGAPEGPYLFIPLFGPRSSLHFAGYFIDYTIDFRNYVDIPTETRAFLAILNGLNISASTAELVDDIERTSVDYYVSVRSFYWQSRRASINNGVLRLEDLPDIEELDDDYEYFETE